MTGRPAFLLIALSTTFAACGDRTSVLAETDRVGGSFTCEEHVDCDDELECNGLEICEGGRCVLGVAPRCDDGDPCTQDGCTEGRGCVHVELGSSCAQELPSDQDSSDPIDGSVFPSDVAEPPRVECPTSAESLTAETRDELEPFRGIACVSGDVQVGSGVTDLSPLSELVRVDGSMTVETVSGGQLPSLRRVGGRLSVSSVSLPSVEWVGGTLEVRGGLVTEGEFPELRYIGSDLVVKVPTDFEPVSVPQALSLVEYIGGNVVVDPTMTAHLGALKTVGGSVLVRQISEAQEGSLANLEVVGEDLTIRGLGKVQSLRLPSLERVGNKVTIFANSELSELSLDELVHARQMEIRLNPALSSCQVDALVEQLEDTLESSPLICCNSGCEECQSATCLTPGAPNAGQSSHLEGSFWVAPDMAASMGAVESAEALEFAIWEEPLPKTLPLLEVGVLEVEATKWADLTPFASLASVDELSLRNNYQLQSLAGLERLERLRSLSISWNSALQSLAAIDPERDGSLAQIESGAITSNGALSQCEAELVGQRLSSSENAIIEVKGNQVCPGTCDGILCSEVAPGL